MLPIALARCRPASSTADALFDATRLAQQRSQLVLGGQAGALLRDDETVALDDGLARRGERGAEAAQGFQRLVTPATRQPAIDLDELQPFGRRAAG